MFIYRHLNNIHVLEINILVIFPDIEACITLCNNVIKFNLTLFGIFAPIVIDEITLWHSFLAVYWV